MTRARKSLTLCETIGGRHPFLRDVNKLVLRSRVDALPEEPGLAHRTWCADPEKVVLSWPGRFPPTAPIHRALADLDLGSPLMLRPQGDESTQWEVTDTSGLVVGRMSSKFQPPKGKIVAVRVAAILVRHARKEERERLACQSWELVLPEIEYLPG